MSPQSAYANKVRDAAEAVSVVQDGDTIWVPIGGGEPPRLLSALSERRREFRDVTVMQLLALRPFDYFDPETVEHVRHASFFLGGASRKGLANGCVDVFTANFSEIPGLIRTERVPTDVVFAMASPMDQHGYFAISLSPDYTMAAISKARDVVLEVSEYMPYTYGHCHVHIDDVSAVVETSDPLIELPLPQVGDVEKAIGAGVADLIPDGATIQMGIGGIPTAVVMELLSSQDLGVHTEMMGDGILTLIEAGVVTNRRKNINPGLMQAAFALGSKKLYEYMDHNPALEMHPVDVTNDPCIAGANDNLYSINGTLQVDLIGQCGSESLGTIPYSGTGGQSDFVRSANRSRGGKSIIVVPSTAKDGAISCITPTLTPGTHVTTSKNDVDAVVTEYGVAHLRGLSLAGRARALIRIAHPDHRARLTQEAEELRLL